MVKVRLDKKGLFTIVDRWIVRPQYSESEDRRIRVKCNCNKDECEKCGGTGITLEESIFKEGDEVEVTRNYGKYAWIRRGKRHTNNYRMEIWEIDSEYRGK